MSQKNYSKCFIRKAHKKLIYFSAYLLAVVFIAQSFYSLATTAGFSFAPANLMATVGDIPLAPSGLALNGAPTSTSIPLGWTDNATNEDSFNIERKLTTDTYWTGAWSVQLAGSNIISYTDSSVAANTAYDYRVQACRSTYGCSDYAYLIGVSSAVNNPGCLLTVSLNSATPAAKSVGSGQNGVSLVKFNLFPNCDITLSSFAVSLLPMPNGYLNISSLRLYKDGVQIGSTLNNPVAGANFTGLNMAIPTGQTIVFEAKGDINTSAAVGSTVYGAFGGSWATSVSGSVGNNASGNIIAGNVMTISSGSSVPNAPTGLMLNGTPTASSIPLKWTDNANNEDKFTVQRKLSSASWSSYVPDSSNSFTIWYANITSYTDTTVTADMTYDYRVMACLTGVGCSSDYAYLSGVSSTGGSLPSSPSSVTASSVSGKIVVSWPSSASAVKYSIYRKTGAGSYQIWYTNITSLYYEDIYPNVATGSTYRYKVFGCASDGSTCSTTATESNIVTYSGGAVSCTSLSLTLNDGKTTYTTSESVNYTWTCLPGGSASNVSIWLQKPDGTSVNYNYGGGITQTMGFGTSNLVPGTHILKACFNSACTTVDASQTFVVASSASPTPTPTSNNYNPTPTPTPSAPYLNAWIDAVPASSAYTSPVTINGLKNAGVTSNSSFPAGTLTFYLYKISSTGTADSTINYYTATVGNISLVSGSQGMTWAGTINAANLPNGIYKFFTKGISNFMEYASNYVYFAVNNTIASTPAPTPTSAIPFITIEISGANAGATIGGFRTLGARSDVALSGLSFEFFSSLSATNNYVAYSVAAGNMDSTYKTWSTGFDTAKLSNGIYYVIAKGLHSGIYYKSGTDYKINIYNSTVNPVPSLQSTNIPYATPMTSPYPYSSFTPPPDDTSGQYSTMPPECVQQGFTTPETCQKYFQFPWECRQQNILDGLKCQEYMFKLAMPEECRLQGATTQEGCANVMFLRFLPEECRKANILDEAGCNKLMSARNFLPLECQSANITAPAECEKYMMQTNILPKDCSDQGVKSFEECRYVLRNKYGNLENTIGAKMALGGAGLTDGFPPECREAGAIDRAACEKVMFAKYAPKDCVDANIDNPKDCERFMFKKNAPADCVEAGMLNPEACKKFMFEKYGDKDNIPPDKFPIECRASGAKSVDECEKIMTKNYLPEECKKNGIDSPEQCDTYLKQKYMPEECRQSGAKTQKECDKVMFKKFAPQECKKAGIEDEKECKDYMFNLYAPKTTCQGLDEWQCNNSIKENHLGNIVVGQADIAKTKEQFAPFVGGSVTAEKLKEKMAESKKKLPVQETNISYKVLAAEEKVLINDENNLVQSSSVALMIDSDGDGLPDDMEKRLGSDPNNPDTDQDGHKDGEEVRNGLSPLGEGKIAEKMAPIDEAILQNKVLSQPNVTGLTSDAYAVNAVANTSNASGDKYKNGYVFSGKAEKNSVVTIYIYSDLPIVTTVKTDEYGNWKYEFDKSLVDGEHEIYVAVNDNTGKVINKSNPLSFFVKEAKAVSVTDYLSGGNTSAPKESEKLIQSYQIIAVLVVIIGILLFSLLIIRKKKQGVNP